MRVFALWNQTEMPDSYGACVAALLRAYPTLEVLRYDSPAGEDARISSDNDRFNVLLNATAPTLYLDCDCTPGPLPFVGGNRLAFANCRGGYLDVWAIYTPGTQEAREELRWILLAGWPYQRWINDHADRYDRIAGQPDDLYFGHRQLGGPLPKVRR